MFSFSHSLRLLSSSVLLAIALPLQALAQTTPQALSLDNIRIVDTLEGSVSEPSCLRIEAGLIASISSAGDAGCRRDSRVHDLADRFVMPGLIDMHAHLTLGPVEVRQEDGSAKISALPDDAIARHNAERLVAFGVTTIRNPGGDLAAAARYREKRLNGDLTGPESFNAGPVINNFDLEGLSVSVGTPEETARVVAEQVEHGADWIKLYTGLSPQLLQAGIDAAHALGRPAVAHLDTIAWPDALAMGLDGIVHLMPISPELLSEAARKAWQAEARPGTFAFVEWWEHFDSDGPQADRLIDAFDHYRPVFDATLVAFHAAFVQDRENPFKADSTCYAHPRLLESWQEGFTFAVGWQPEDFRRARAIWPKVQRLAQRIYASRARVTIGTDMGNPWIAPGISVHREMALLVDSGVPAARVLRAATTIAADALGAGERIGQIARGFEADLLVLEANPLQTIENSRLTHAVVLDGIYIPSERLSKLKGARACHSRVNITEIPAV